VALAVPAAAGLLALPRAPLARRRDAEVVREFDLGLQAFRAGRFRLAEAKSDVAW
jgi:hypothetical protein